MLIVVMIVKCWWWGWLWLFWLCWVAGAGDHLISILQGLPLYIFPGMQCNHQDDDDSDDDDDDRWATIWYNNCDVDVICDMSTCYIRLSRSCNNWSQNLNYFSSSESFFKPGFSRQQPLPPTPHSHADARKMRHNWKQYLWSSSTSSRWWYRPRLKSCNGPDWSKHPHGGRRRNGPWEGNCRIPNCVRKNFNFNPIAGTNNLHNL